MGSMYKVKPIVADDQSIELPKCMYKAPFLYETATVNQDSSAESSENSANSHSIVSYCAAFEEISKQQQELCKHLDALESKHKPKADTSDHHACNEHNVAIVGETPTVHNSFNCHDICIHYDLNYKPIAILLLLEWLKRKHNFNIAVNIHLQSDVLSKNEHELKEWKEIQKQFNSGNSTLNRTEYTLTVTFIVSSMNNGKQPILFLNPASRTKIHGIVNQLRFLFRLIIKAIPTLTSLYPESENSSNLIKIDSLLDEIDSFLIDGPVSIEKLILKLNTLLASNKYIFEKLTVADFVIFEIGNHFVNKLDETNGDKIKAWLSFMKQSLTTV